MHGRQNSPMLCRLLCPAPEVAMIRWLRGSDNNRWWLKVHGTIEIPRCDPGLPVRCYPPDEFHGPEVLFRKTQMQWHSDLQSSLELHDPEPRTFRAPRGQQAARGPAAVS